MCGKTYRHSLIGINREGFSTGEARGIVVRHDRPIYASVASSSGGRFRSHSIVLTAVTDHALGAVSSGAPAASACLLDELALRQPGRVVRVTAPATMPEWQAWLSEIGFLPGEPVMILTRGHPGGDPLVVRVGDSTFALRRAEAACIEVAPAPAAIDRSA